MTRLPIPLMACLLWACAPEDTVDIADPAEGEDGNVQEPQDDGDSNDLAEADCEDGTDDDDDGLTDCADPDCDGAFVCTWPTDVGLHTVVDYDANDFAEAFGVTDCSLEISGSLPEGATGQECAECDLQYQGQVAYDMGNCPDDYISTPNPLTYGLIFIDEDTREFWTRDADTGAWEYLGEATRRGDGTFLVTSTETVWYDVILIGETDVGTFTIRRTFTDG